MNNDDETVLHVNITSVNTVEGDLDDNNQLTFIIGASRELKDGESVTLNLNINDITTDSSDYGFLSQDTITLDSTNQYQTITLDIFGDEEKEASETLSLNATVSSMSGVTDVQIISDTATIYDDDAGATPYDDFLTLTDEADTMDALAGDDVVFGKGGSLNFNDMSLENITTCQNNLIANNYLHVDMKEVA